MKQKETAYERKQKEIISEKQRLKERDGFCRRVDTYDGNVIMVDKKPTYEIGNYLGGGVAGVVYQGHRLRPIDEYPVRFGIYDAAFEDDDIMNPIEDPDTSADNAGGFFCATPGFASGETVGYCGEVKDTEATTIPAYSAADKATESSVTPSNNTKAKSLLEEEADWAIETSMNQDERSVVMLDAQDAPSRSQHFTRAAGVGIHGSTMERELKHGLTDEAVAVKILNPVGYRILQSDAVKGAVVVKKGEPMPADVKKGDQPIQEKHVWWIVNPNSRNLRTLQRYNEKDKNSTSKTVQVDRGSQNKGLRLSLIAAFIDPKTNDLRELTLTRCIEIWGHVPFNATDNEFDDMMTAIERVNAGQPPPPVNAFTRDHDSQPGRVGTDVTGNNSTVSSEDPPPASELKVQRT